MRVPLPLMPTSVADFSALAFVQRACASPFRPSSVLSFFYGYDFDNPEHHVEAMREGHALVTMQGIWYSSNNAYDELCRNFSPVIRSVVGEQPPPPEWNDSVNGVMSQLLLCDQLSRNCFRGTEEAFQYDVKGVALAKQLVQHVFSIPNESNSSLPGEFYPTYSTNVITALMHSEEASNLKLAGTVLELFLQRYNKQEIVAQSLMFQKTILAEHEAIVTRFGRYPHRNAKLGRISTPQELAWLDDTENLPGWAKSQA